jgi:hypothetical protein
MLTESVMTCALENLAAMQQNMAVRLQQLGLKPDLVQQVQSAAAKAFSAICLNRDDGQQVRAALEITRGELCLRMIFDGEEEPTGLAAALYCPPALRVAFRHQQGFGVWTVFWEI